MKATTQIDSALLIESDRNVMPVVPTPVTDFSYQQRKGAPAQTVAAPTKKNLPELTTFRALSRQVFGAEAAREFLKEDIAFALVTLVAAWPLGMTINLLANIIW
jgi:hypothetical protein